MESKSIQINQKKFAVEFNDNLPSFSRKSQNVISIILYCGFDIVYIYEPAPPPQPMTTRRNFG